MSANRSQADGLSSCPFPILDPLDSGEEDGGDVCSEAGRPQPLVLPVVDALLVVLVVPVLGITNPCCRTWLWKELDGSAWDGFAW